MDNLDTLWNYCEGHFKLQGGDHGPSHWRRVERNAIALAAHTGANELFVRIFAAIHDSCRENEFDDPAHGSRAADLADKLRGEYFELEEGLMQNLRYALSFHDTGDTCIGNPNIGTCWDADRLDLPRVGIVPLPRFFSTDAGREKCLEIIRNHRDKPITLTPEQMLAQIEKLRNK